MKTKHKENRKKTKSFKEMKDKFLAERLIRTWSEDFVDEDNGEVVSVERHEIIMEKGTLLTHDKLTEIKFFIDAGDIKEVDVSDIQRECGRVFKNATIWIISIELNGKGKTVYLYALNLERAIDTVTDYIEQTQAGSFSIKAIKRADYINLLAEKGEENENEGDKEINTYKVEVQVELTGEMYTYRGEYILKATDVEDAKKTITDFITKQKIDAEDSVDFDLVVISAKTIPCEYIIGLDFSRDYLKVEKEETELGKINREILELLEKGKAGTPTER